jgi:uncharacterized protein (TIGR00303 family)
MGASVGGIPRLVGMTLSTMHTMHGSMLRGYCPSPQMQVQVQAWLQGYRHQLPGFVCVLGFTATGLIPGISAAGAAPADRQLTAVADAEFLINGPQPYPKYVLPPLTQGASPVLITRAVVTELSLPVYLFNAGLPVLPAVPAIDLGGRPAECITTGQAMPLEVVRHLWQQGLEWGEKLARQHPYLVISECVVGGTTTALSLLTGLGYACQGKVNSSHPQCNHAQKWQVVQQGWQAANMALAAQPTLSPINWVAALGDPMQIVVAGMAMAASRTAGVLLAGGTQMLAVYALAKALATAESLAWRPEAVLVGTTRWVAADPTGDTAGLAALVGAPLVATQLSFAQSRYPQLQAYERGFVKEGVGAGGAAIVAHLMADWGQSELLQAIEAVATAYATIKK